MKKIIPVTIIVILIGIGLYFFLTIKKGSTSSVGGSNSMAEGNKTGNNENIFTNIRDALSKSVAFSCTYPDPTGKTRITTYVKNGVIRVSNIINQESAAGNMIMKDNKIWIWDEVKKEGMIFSINKDQITPGQSQKDQREEMIDEMQKNSQFCKIENVSDSLFTPPSNVKFQDLEALMKGQQDIMKNIPTGMIESESVLPEESTE